MEIPHTLQLITFVGEITCFVAQMCGGKRQLTHLGLVSFERMLMFLGHIGFLHRVCKRRRGGTGQIKNVQLLLESPVATPS